LSRTADGDFDGDLGGSLLAVISVSFFLTPFSTTSVLSSSSSLSFSSSSSAVEFLCFLRISSTASKSPLSTALQQN